MKTITIGLAALLLSTAASFAADAWKEADVGGTKIFTDAKGMTLYTYDKDEKGKSQGVETPKRDLGHVNVLSIESSCFGALSKVGHKSLA